ncbi:hypothetical protein EDB86DRAFT_3073295 [Lactarius hatsudake]|nr:hypothetical protein EDB86DRAFT_3073295 [Lactarius hatsudake]
MSSPDSSVDVERGQVLEKLPGVDTSGHSPLAGEKQRVENQGSVGRAGMVQDTGFKFSLPSPESPGTSHSKTERWEAAHPTLPFSHVQTAEQEDFVGNPDAPAEQGSGASRIPRDIAHSQGADYGAAAIFGDPSRQMWTLSLSQFEKYDREIIDRWKSDTDGVLVFTGLFSATVASFVIESYKGLSVDSGSQTVVLLTQMSQQLVGISNGTILPTPPPLSNSPPNLPSAVRVNILWLLSLAISITCALLATLIQQWTRRYMALSYLHDMPHERARVRTFLFTGMELFRMRQAVEAIPMLLHTSVFLFFAGLVDFFLLFNQTVAWVFIGWIGLFVSVYVAMTIIPNIIFSCPYHTPFTGLFWRLSQLLAVAGLILRNTFTITLDSFLRLIWRRIHGAPIGIKSLPGREKLMKRIAAHKHWFTKGLQQRVVSNAIETSSLVDRDALIWTLTKLDEVEQVEDYISRIPGFFNSRVVPEASKTMLGLMDGGDSVLAARLNCLLRSCLSTNAVDPGIDKNRLYICLKAIWCYAKAYCQTDQKEIPTSKCFRRLFADENEMNTLLAHDNLHTKVLVLCIRSLLVARLVEEARSQTEIPQVSEGELVFIKKALGPLWRLDLADHRPMELTNLDSMLSELAKVVNEKLRGGETLGLEVLETMNILAERVINSISSCPTTKHRSLYLSVLDHACRTLERCLSLSTQCGADTRLGHILRSDALDSLTKILGDLNGRLARHVVPGPHPESHAHPQSVNEGMQFMTDEDRIRHSLIASTIGATPSMKTDALTSTLAGLDDDDELEAFIARIPNLFDSYTVSDTSINIILDLMAPGGGETAFASRLHRFYRACLSRTSPLDLAVRKRRLHVCLAAIWSYAREYCNADPHRRTIPEHFQRLFADPNDVDLLSVDEDAHSRVMMLCINSLLATKIVEDVRHRSVIPAVSEGELAFLQKTLGSFWQPGLFLHSLGTSELATLFATLNGVAMLSPRETPSIAALGREASETLEILAKNVLDKLPEDPPPEPWGSSASTVGRSLEALEWCLSLLKQLSVNADGFAKSAWMDVLMGRLNDFGAKLAQHSIPG